MELDEIKTLIKHGIACTEEVQDMESFVAGMLATLSIQGHIYAFHADQTPDHLFGLIVLVRRTNESPTEIIVLD